ncbi:ABC transporter substrate-binding protein [Lonsdalea quercina]|uniref:ABC transporter substrate-binding protein n=1 Tax=Lonsdalea quercina TaxID=71657 RepID=UPI003974CD57
MNLLLPLPRPASTILIGSLLLGGCFDRETPTADGAASPRIRVAMLLPPRSGLSPFSDDAFKLSRWSTAETLIKLDANGDAQPALATHWRPLDETTWHLTLRPGVKFHDDRTMDAASVVNALTAATRAVPKPRILDGVELTIRADGDRAVIIKTARRDPLLPQRLSSPQLAILSPAAYGKNGVVNPIKAGTGPFVLTRVNGTSSAHLDRFDRYWGTPAAAPGIDVDFVPNGAARAAALRTRSVDVVEAIPVSQAPLLDPARVHEVPMPRTNTLYLNTRRGAFSDPALRAAARDAINRAELVNGVYEQRADMAVGLLGPALQWAAPLRQPITSPTPAGMPHGATITLATFSDRTELPEVAVYLAQQLSAAGFTVKQEVREYAQIESDALAGKFDAFILSRATVLDSGDPVAYLYSDFACHGSFNLSQLCHPDVDQALQEAAGIPAGEARRQAIMRAERRILATDAAIPLLHERVIQGESDRVRQVIRDPRERELITSQTTVNQAPSTP